MPMYNLIEYSDNYSKASGSLRQYTKDIPQLLTLLITILLIHLILK